MDADRIRQIRQALTDELGDKWRIEDGGNESLFPIRSNVYPFSIDIELHMWQEGFLDKGLAAIGRALLAAAGETMIPLADAVRVVEEACMSERRRCEGDYYGDMYGGAAIDGVEENAIAALQALGGGENG